MDRIQLRDISLGNRAIDPGRSFLLYLDYTKERLEEHRERFLDAIEIRGIKVEEIKNSIQIGVFENEKWSNSRNKEIITRLMTINDSFEFFKGDKITADFFHFSHHTRTKYLNYIKDKNYRMAIGVLEEVIPLVTNLMIKSNRYRALSRDLMHETYSLIQFGEREKKTLYTNIGKLI